MIWIYDTLTDKPIDIQTVRGPTKLLPLVVKDKTGQKNELGVWASNFSFGLNQKLDFALNYPKNIIQLLWQGNEPFIGEEVEVDNIYFDYTSKFEYFIGYSHSFFDKRLTIGFKSKLIKGLQNASVEYANSTFNTKDEVQNYFELTANTNYLLNTSNFIPITESISNILGTLKYYSLSQNYGYGFDICLKANIAEKFNFSFSVCDLGKISLCNQVSIST